MAKRTPDIIHFEGCVMVPWAGQRRFSGSIDIASKKPEVSIKEGTDGHSWAFSWTPHSPTCKNIDLTDAKEKESIESYVAEFFKINKTPLIPGVVIRYKLSSTGLNGKPVEIEIYPLNI